MRQIHGLRDTEQFAGRDVADDGLLALRRDLFDTKMSVEQEIKVVGFRALIEDCVSLQISKSTALPAAVRPVRRAQGQRTSAGSRPASGRLRPSIPSFQSPQRISAAEASLNGLPDLLARNSVRRLRWRNIGRTGRRYLLPGSPVNPGRKIQETGKKRES